MEKLTKEQYLERIKAKQSVNRFEFELDFKFSEVNEEFKKVLANLTMANLTRANLTGAKGGLPLILALS